MSTTNLKGPRCCCYNKSFNSGNHLRGHPLWNCPRRRPCVVPLQPVGWRWSSTRPVPKLQEDHQHERVVGLAWKYSHEQRQGAGKSSFYIKGWLAFKICYRDDAANVKRILWKRKQIGKFEWARKKRTRAWDNSYSLFNFNLYNQNFRHNKYNAKLTSVKNFSRGTTKPHRTAWGATWTTG